MKYFNRYTQQIEMEDIPGKNGLIFLYDTVFGNYVVEFLIKKPWFSRLAAVWANSKFSKRRIARFIQTYHIDMSPFEACDYLHFNDFFYRKLKEGQRPITKEKNAICFPVIFSTRRIDSSDELLKLSRITVLYPALASSTQI